MTHLFWVYTEKRRKVSKRNKTTITIKPTKHKKQNKHTDRKTKTWRREGLMSYYLTHSHVSDADIHGGQRHRTSWGKPFRLLIGQILQTFSFKIQVHLKHDFGGDLCVATGEGGLQVKEWALEILFKEKKNTRKKTEVHQKSKRNNTVQHLTLRSQLSLAWANLFERRV